MDVKTLKDIDLEGKKVLIRTDYNVPMDSEGNVTDTMRIEESIPTLKYILEHNALQLIIVTHIGRPKGYDEKLKTDKVAQKLSEILRMGVKKVDNWGEDGLGEERIVILENARFNPSEKSKDEAERDEFGRLLCKNADVFVMEAFSNMHRGKQASMTSTLKFLPACLGFAAEKEIDTISQAIRNPKRPLVAIMGGAKADKLSSIENIMQHSDLILIGGSLAFNILYSLGYNVGESKVDKQNLQNFEHVIEKIRNNNKIILPKDAVVADELQYDANSRVVSVDNIEDGWMALDIGPETIKAFEEKIHEANTVIWNGPLGLFEFEAFAKGTVEVAKCIAQSNAFSIIGGGDSAAAIHKAGVSENVGFISSGGGASLWMFEGKELPVLEKMKENSSNF
ncbi:MAG: phosphoglycerate kinase [Candidatus Nanoarchaeia archaeon]